MRGCFCGKGQTVTESPSGGTFVTGEQGQSLYGGGKLGRTPAVRNEAAQAALPGKEPGDHASHLLGARFGFEGESYNLTPLAGSEVNLGGYKRIENFWANLQKQGHEVTAEVFALHRSNPLRPDKIVVPYSVDNGQPVTLVRGNPLPKAATPSRARRK